MSDGDANLLFSLILLLLAIVAVVAPPLARAIKREAAMPSKFRADGKLDDDDEAVRRWHAASRLPACRTCKYWQPIWYGGKGPQLIDGVCHRYPPHISRRKRVTSSTTSCGEHAPEGGKP